MHQYVNSFGHKEFSFPLKSLVEFMLEYHEAYGRHCTWFQVTGDIYNLVANFLRTKDCFVQHQERYCTVEVLLSTSLQSVSSKEALPRHSSPRRSLDSGLGGQGQVLRIIADVISSPQHLSYALSADNKIRYLFEPPLLDLACHQLPYTTSVSSFGWDTRNVAVTVTKRFPGHVRFELAFRLNVRDGFISTGSEQSRSTLSNSSHVAPHSSDSGLSVRNNIHDDKLTHDFGSTRASYGASIGVTSPRRSHSSLLRSRIDRPSWTEPGISELEQDARRIHPQLYETYGDARIRKYNTLPARKPWGNVECFSFYGPDETTPHFLPYWEGSRCDRLPAHQTGLRSPRGRCSQKRETWITSPRWQSPRTPRRVHPRKVVENPSLPSRNIYDVLASSSPKSSYGSDEFHPGRTVDMVDESTQTVMQGPKSASLPTFMEEDPIKSMESIEASSTVLSEKAKGKRQAVEEIDDRCTCSRSSNHTDPRETFELEADRDKYGTLGLGNPSQDRKASISSSVAAYKWAHSCDNTHTDADIDTSDSDTATEDPPGDSILLPLQTYPRVSVLPYGPYRDITPTLTPTAPTRERPDLRSDNPAPTPTPSPRKRRTKRSNTPPHLESPTRLQAIADAEQAQIQANFNEFLAKAEAKHGAKVIGAAQDPETKAFEAIFIGSPVSEGTVEVCVSGSEGGEMDICWEDGARRGRGGHADEGDWETDAHDAGGDEDDVEWD